MMKVVINKCYGGFGLSPEAELRLYELGCKSLEVTHVDKYWPLESRKKHGDSYILGYENALQEWRDYLVSEKKSLFIHTFSPDEQFVLNARDIERHDPFLLQVIEEMGDKANAHCAKLEIVEIPDGIEYEIEEYDGREWVSEKHRTWS